MKYLLSLIFVFSIVSCTNDKPASDKSETEDFNTEEKTEQTDQSNTGDNAINIDNPTDLDISIPGVDNYSVSKNEAPAQVSVPAGADGVVHHFVCEDKCEGGFSNEGGNCQVCGKPFAHNTAFHSLEGSAGDQEVPPLPKQSPEPAQNANGVWHYTCSNGCPGGAGGPDPCAVCGATLAHNAGYHN